MVENSLEHKILIQNFIEQARKSEDDIALDCKEQQFSYKELLNKTSAVANLIIDIDDIQGDTIAVWASKKPGTYIGVLSALMASKGYMPLNPKFPESRNVKILSHTSCNTLIADPDDIPEIMGCFGQSGLDINLIVSDQSAVEHEVDNDVFTLYIPGDNDKLPEIKSSEEDIAYLLFTSGTTGNPKGVPVSNKNVIAYLNNVYQRFDFNKDDKFSQLFDLTFDLSVHDLFACWLCGACLCIPEDENSLKVAKYMKEKEISVWFSVPSQINLLSKMRMLETRAFPSIRYSLFCGEPLKVDQIVEWKKAVPSSKIFNLYGPTETTIAVTAYEWNPILDQDKSKNGIASIGKVFDDQDYMLFRKDDPLEKYGFLCISGDQVVKAYFDSGNDNDCFFTQDGKDWYNTGDVIEEDKDGDLFFMGRQDYEVKISGFRVNVLEIEDVLKDIIAKDVVVIPVKDEDGIVTELVTYVTGPDRGIDQEKVFQICRNQLPWYMMPSKIITISEFPVNDNKKVDRKKLSELYNG